MQMPDQSMHAMAPEGALRSTHPMLAFKLGQNMAEKEAANRAAFAAKSAERAAATAGSPAPVSTKGNAFRPISAGVPLNLFSPKMGKDASGRDLDAMDQFKKYDKCV